MGNAAAGAARGDVTTAGSAWPQIGLGIATFLWAGNFIAGRALRGDIGPIELNVWRWAIALAVLLPFTVGALWRQRAILRQHAGLVLGLGVTGVAVPHACVYAALRATTAVNAGGANGLLYGNPKLLAIQAVAVVVSLVYSFAVTFLLLKVLDKIMGLRVAKEDEIQGLDLSLHGESGYNF